MNVFKKLFKREVVTLEVGQFARALEDKDVPAKLRKDIMDFVHVLMKLNNEKNIGEKTVELIESWSFTHHYTEEEWIKVYKSCPLEVDNQLELLIRESEVLLEEQTEYVKHYDIRAKKSIAEIL